MIVKTQSQGYGEVISTGTPGFGKHEHTCIKTITLEFPDDNTIHETPEFKLLWDAIENLGKKHYSPQL